MYLWTTKLEALHTPVRTQCLVKVGINFQVGAANDKSVTVQKSNSSSRDEKWLQTSNLITFSSCGPPCI